jgi:hypothetical protein
MFQIAGIKSLAKDNQTDAYFYNIHQQLEKLNNDQKHNPDLKHAKEYLLMFKNLDLTKNWNKEKPRKTVKLPFHYEPIKFENYTLYDGFFQSAKYFDHNRKYILNLFEPSAHVKNALKKYNNLLIGITCSIHVRRGDYLKFGLHVSREMDYYNKCIERVGKVDKYLIFSDDINWCKTKFKGDQYIFIENEKDYVEIFLQSKCTHNIISSSSFSWWGAYLNQGINKKIIGPKQWFSWNKPNNIIPEEWQTI